MRVLNTLGAGTFVLKPVTRRERQVANIGDDVRLAAGDLLRILSVEGGGWGDPLERPLQRVLEDARRRFASFEVARIDYGVIIEPRRRPRQRGEAVGAR